MGSGIQVEEEWKWLYGLNTHQVSNLGKIRSVDRTVILKSGRVVQKKGTDLILKQRQISKLFSVYFNVYDAHGVMIQKTIFIHKAVAEHFVPKPPSHNENDARFDYRRAVHIDKDYSNNIPSNLKWMTYSESVLSQNRVNGKTWKTRRELYGETGQYSCLNKAEIARQKALFVETPIKAVYIENKGIVKKVEFLKEEEYVYDILPPDWRPFYLGDQTKENPSNSITVPNVIYDALEKGFMPPYRSEIEKAIKGYLDSETRSFERV